MCDSIEEVTVMVKGSIELLALLTLLEEKGLISKGDAQNIASLSNLVEHLTKTGVVDKNVLEQLGDIYKDLVDSVRGYLSSSGEEKERIKEKIVDTLKGGRISAKQIQRDFEVH